MTHHARAAWKIQVGERLSKARREAKLGQVDLAAQLGISKQLASHWEAGSSEITSWDVVRLARLLNVDTSWLLTGRERRSQSQSPGDGIVIKASLTQLLDFANSAAFFSESERKELLYGGLSTKARVHSPCLSGRAVAFEAWDRAMAPEIDVGDLVVVDRSVAPINGDIVLSAILESGQLLLRRYHRATPVRPIILSASAAKYFPEQRLSDPSSYVFMGTLVENTRFRRARAGAESKSSRERVT